MGDCPMTPAEFRAIRHALGLGTPRMGRLLGVAGGRTVRKWEASERPLTGPAIILIWVLWKFPDVLAQLIKLCQSKDGPYADQPKK